MFLLEVVQQGLQLNIDYSKPQWWVGIIALALIFGVVCYLWGYSTCQQEQDEEAERWAEVMAMEPPQGEEDLV